MSLGMVTSLAVSSAAIFVAELGDKSQLLAMSFATRYRAWQVLVGITVATTLMHAVSVGLGFGLGVLIPAGWAGLLAGIAFLGFALWTILGDELAENDRHASTRGAGSIILAVTIAFFLAEFGDKTMLATVTLATDYDWFGTWIGSTVGMVLADALAIGVGLALGKHLPERAVRYSATGLFIIFGLWLTVSSILELL